MKTLLTLICCALVQFAAAQVTTIKILPSVTDSAINTFSGPEYLHFAYIDKSVKKRNQLLVFMAGTNGKGGGGADFNSFAATLGYHVVNVIYPDGLSMSHYQRFGSLRPYETGRTEIITGKDVNPDVKVNRANSIENRLIKLLTLLNQRHPDQGWGQYLDASGNIVWSKIAVAGQSQGGGHAGFIAKHHEVARVVMLGSPKDYNVRLGQSPEWISMLGKTPLSRQFSFVHSMDDHNACTYPEQQKIWKAYGLYTFGNEVDVDKAAPPYNHTHLLTSTKPQPNAHGSVVKDAGYKEAWRYMLTADE